MHRYVNTFTHFIELGGGGGSHKTVVIAKGKVGYERIDFSRTLQQKSEMRRCIPNCVMLLRTALVPSIVRKS